MYYLKPVVHRYIKSRRAKILAAIVVTIVIGFAGARFLGWIGGKVSVEDIVREMNFRPADPPQSPEYPGTLYLVNSFGKMTSTVCKSGVSDSNLTPKDVENRIILTGANVQSKVKTRSGGSDLRVSISFKDSKLFEHDVANLNKIAAQLQGQRLCREALDEYIGEGRCVVQSQSILVSTVELIENSTGKVIIGPDRGKLLELLTIKGALEGSKLQFGEKLQYGLRLRDRCITKADIKYPRFVPDETWWLFKSSWNFVLSLWERII